VDDGGDLNPSLIFERMNDYVKQSLRQVEASEVTDGMEGAIVVIDEKNQSAQFSGARMNVIHATAGAVNLIRGSKLTVGTVEEHVSEPPVVETIQIAPGDSIYLYSDGVVDQFGANDKGKYKISRLKALLASIANSTVAEQEAMIRTTFNQWKGDVEQIDDVTLMGMKF
jgi:serine phosphatase RsbU (regulator of sigma subunit)